VVLRRARVEDRVMLSHARLEARRSTGEESPSDNDHRIVSPDSKPSPKIPVGTMRMSSKLTVPIGSLLAFWKFHPCQEKQS